MKARSMIWRLDQDICVSMIEQLQWVLSAVELLRVEQTGNLSVVSMIPRIIRGKAHNYSHVQEQLLSLRPLGMFE